MQKRYGMLINLNRCIGCYACQVTCKAEYDIPFGTFRCRVETYQSGKYPDVKKFFLPRLCNHCGNAPCIEACDENALYKNEDGVVIINYEICTGCTKCYDRCPYNAIEINPYSGKAEKCNFCYSRIRKGLLPVCVQSCMGKAIIFGDMNDGRSPITDAMRRLIFPVTSYKEYARYPFKVKTLNPDLGTYPSVFYVFKGDTLNSPLKNVNPAQLIKGDENISPSPLPSYIKGGGITIVPSSLVEEDKGEGVFSEEKQGKLIYTSDAMCPSECGIAVVVKDGVAEKIYGNPHSLINNGAFCAKGASGLQLTYSPYRVKTPLIRAGKRGEDKWKSITWDEAADYIAKKLIKIKSQFGPESVFLDTGDVTDREAYYRLFHAFGTPHTYNHGSICDPNRRWGQGIMMGDERPLPDVQRPILIRNDKGETYLKTQHDAKLILNIGVNPFVATRFNYMSYGIPAARDENGCIYIVVDPACTNSASHADIWLPIRPGTDAHLLAAMLYYIIKNDSSQNPYIAHDFLKDYTIGWDEFKKAFLSYTERIDPSNNFAYFTPEWAAEKTGISIDNIKKIAHLFGITKPAAIEIGMHGTSHHTNGDVASILMVALCLVTGNMDRPGGLVFIESQKVKKGDMTIGKEFLEKEVTRKIDSKAVSGKLSELHKDLYGDYPTAWKGVLSDIPRKIREGIRLKHGPFKGYTYPVKALIVRAGNPVITGGNTTDWIDALTALSSTPLPRGEGARERVENASPEYQLELMVVIDTHVSATGKYADVILPEAGFLERMGLSDVYTMSPEIAIREQVIKPLYESKTPFEIMLSLSDALIKNGDQDIREEDFRKRYRDEEDFINKILMNSPGFYNIGKPLPYPDIPEGALILGTPDNPTAVFNKEVIKHGERLTVNWLRKHKGVAVWHTSYYRYKKTDSSPSDIYPKTRSKRFEFKFTYLEEINKKFKTSYPTTFYWSECKCNPKNSSYINVSKEYPFQLISGRVHYAMTMTGVCPYLAETETECMKPLNNGFKYEMPDTKDLPDKYGLPKGKEIFLNEGSVSIPVFAFNNGDALRLDIKTGDAVILENQQKKAIKGKAFLTDEIMPGVIKTAFGPGGQKTSGIGFVNNTAEYTSNINELFDPSNLTDFTGMPGLGDIIVKVVKIGVT